MALEDIIKKINEEADKSVASIMHESRQKAKDVLSSAKGDAKKQTEKIFSAKQQDAHKEKTYILSQANMSARINILQKKQQVIDQVFDKAKEHFEKMDQDSYGQLIAKMLLHCAFGDEEVVVWEKDKRVNQALIDGVNSQLKKQNKPGDLKLSFSKELIESGFVLKGKSVVIDNSFPAVLEQLRPALLQDLSRILFE